jgi:hypothetical protein
MKSILEPSFKYRPSSQTDVRKTFERIRREQAEERRRQAPAAASATVKVLDRRGSA